MAGVAYYYVVSRRSMGAAAVLLVALVASVHSYWVYHQPVAEGLRLGTTALFIAVNACFAWAAWLQCPARVERVDKRMGDLTYGVYLIHVPVTWVMAVFSFVPPLESVLVVIGSFAIAWLIFVCVERPLFTLRDTFRGSRLYD